MNHATSAVASLDPEMVQVGDAVGQRAERRGLVQGAVRPVGVVEVLVLAHHDHQMPWIPDQGSVQQFSPAAADPVPLENRIWPVTCTSSVRHAACMYSLIRPLRTGFRRICSASMSGTAVWGASGSSPGTRWVMPWCGRAVL